MSKRLRVGSIVTAVVTSLAPVGDGEAQASRDSSSRTMLIVPAPEYRATGLKEKFLGHGWRDFWTTPVDAPLFNIDSHSGGLKFLKRGGGMQTLSLHYIEKNGWKEYQFRSVNKYPLIQAFPPAVRGVFAGQILQDQVAHLFPGAPVLLPPFLQAIGALHVKPDFFAMPNDPRLGIYRDTFATMLGTVELSPQEKPDDQRGFAGSTEIENGLKFLENVEKDRGNLLDEKELYAIRLVDFMVNDPDRSADNMRFARFGEKGAYSWRALSRDRDRAFADASGWLVKFFMKPVYPKLISFGTSYDLEGLTFTGHEIDRRLLQRVTQSDADQIALRVQRSITDDVIESAIAKLPTRWKAQASETARLRSVLRWRRDNIPDVSRQFYASLASEVDLHGTDEDELVVVDRQSDGRTSITITGKGDNSGVAPFIARTFDPAETNEVRVYLHDGKDRGVVRGASNDKVIVRLIGGGGDDILVDSTSGSGIRFYDEKGDNKFEPAKKTKVSDKTWTAPKEGAGARFDAPWRPDWGAEGGFGPAASFANGGGLVIGFGPRYKSNGFRRLPHKIEASANLLLGTANGKPGVNAKVDYRAENSPVILLFEGRATKFDAFSFRGFGNESPELTSKRALVNQDVIAIEPRYVYQIGYRDREADENAIVVKDSVTPGLRPMEGRFSVGPVVYWTRTHETSSSPFSAQPADVRDVEGRVGGKVMFEIDRTSGGAVADRGFTFESALAAYPKVWDVNKAFGTAAATAAVRVPLPGNGTHFAVRGGGEVASTGVPILHSPAIGGRQTLRGYSWRRFAGDKTAFGSAELRVPVGILPLFVRWNAGVFGLADAGRVWYQGDSDENWHTAFGGGVWLSALGQSFNVSYAKGESGHFYVSKGLSF